jgi:hypothetical protein
MTTADEITLKTPDGLMNGQSIVDVIQSCCPSVKDAWAMPSTDVDSLLIAVRIASYGTDMEVGTICPHCKAENDYIFNLPNILDSIKCPDYNTPVMFDGLEIKLTPLDYLNVTQTNIRGYEEQRILDSIKNPEVTEEQRNELVRASVERVMQANEQSILMSTEYIKTEDGEVITDKAFIKEYYQEASNQAVKAVAARLNEISEEGALPVSTIACDDCKKEFKVPLVFDYSSFFDLSS